jgi:hypothetical protein
MEKNIIITSLVLTSALLLSACGGSGGGNSSATIPSNLPPVDETDKAEEQQAESYQLFIEENKLIPATGLSLTTTLIDTESVLMLQSDGFPNKISKLTFASGQEITELSEISKAFQLFVNPLTGEVEVKLNKVLDFEGGDTSFALEIQLGTKVINLKLDVYDVQMGTEQEPLIISSYNELKSFAAGKFISDNIGLDKISNLPELNQNIGSKGATNNNSDRIGLYVAFDRDIDASASVNDPWQAIEHVGHINGRHHVINNLSMQGFIKNPTAQSNSSLNSNSISNLGFVNATMSDTVLSMPAGNVSKVFVEGLYQQAGTGQNAYFTPFSISGKAKSIYTNIYYDLTQATKGVRISGLLNSSTSSVEMDSAYSNGALSSRTFQGEQNINIAGLSQSGITFGTFFSGANNNTSLYSALKMDFNMVNPKYDFFGENNLTDHRYSGLAEGSTVYPENIESGSLAENRSDYQWKFVERRDQSMMTITHGNLRRDTDVNAGLPVNGPDVSAAAISEAELMQAGMFTGKWLNSNFAIEEGEYPVLTNMPYPHTEGASWMSAEDPGVAYQRATYNDYLTAP